MKIKIVAVGHIKDEYWKQAISEYVKRLSPFSKVEIIEIEDEPIPNKASLAEEVIVKTKECKGMLKVIHEGEYVVALDLNASEYDSVKFSKHLEDMFVKGHSSITFVIGGSLGLSDELRTRANERLTLSKMTFTHQMTRVILLEQIYRGFKIANNESYHK